ncbi:ABC transporter substrate-binding protein [Microbacterium album]|uniref:ABC transporter periplasmic component n=1 Tax=Microbacterium album TaxID=2053191 RepID=A0A917IDJ9_9MICO|nr:extracellular solute-binding protein [Microbacterium album]GGH36719.1 ABC transporter periplasmic component [Microbacterium album]
MSRRQRWLLATALIAPLALLASCASDAAPAAPGGDGDGSGFGGALGTPEQEEAFAELYDAALAAGENQVVAYGPPPARALLDAFHARFPGIELNYQQLQTAERIAKLEQEKQTGNHVADIASDGRTPIVSMAVDGWCQQLDPIMDLPEEWTGPDSRAYFPYVSIFGLVVNTDLIDPEDAPQSWEELVSPEWKGDVVMVSPAAGGAAAFTFAMMQTPEENAEKYEGIMEGIKENVSLVARDALVLQEVAQGTYPVGALAYYPYYVETAAQGAPIEFVFPFTEGGGNMWTKSGNCLIENAPNPNAGRLWMEWLLSIEGQTVLAESGWYPTMPGMPGPGGLPPLEEIDLLYALPDEEAITAYGPYVQEVIAFFGG